MRIQPPKLLTAEKHDRQEKTAEKKKHRNREEKARDPSDRLSVDLESELNE